MLNRFILITQKSTNGYLTISKCSINYSTRYLKDITKGSNLPWREKGAEFREEKDEKENEFRF